MTPQPSIAHFRMISKLGEGGMGAVYRALDTKLNRDVAIKVLPEAFAQDAARMQRFEREAQVLASLNHPNIAAIYGIERGAIIMELVDGEDLKGPVPVETAIHYARQIAVGLEAAHEKGIIHRDLKPANIKVTPDGTLKLLDFGLAKAGEETASAISGTSPTISPTLSLAMTQAGVILGTAAYMSPEQARGKPVDKRADIWAFGVVLYELLTGIAIFGGGETATDAIAAVITKDPDWSALPADTPPRVCRLIERCLRRDPKQRLRDIGDARLILDEPEPASAAPPPAATPRRTWLPWSAAALALLAAGAAWLPSKPPEPGPGAARFRIEVPTGIPASHPNAPQSAPSPDGRNLAIVAGDAGSGTESLWVRPLGATAAYRLDKTEGATFPFWSPDGQFSAFFAEDKLKRIAVSGDSVQTVCEVASAPASRTSGDGGAWSKDGVIVFASLNGALKRVPAIGGMPTPVTVLEPNEGWHSWPQFLPDGRHLLYLAVTKDRANSAIYVRELGSPKRVRILQNATRAAWSPPGYLLFVREGTLFAQRMDPNALRLKGEPIAVAEDVAAADGNGRSAFTVSQNGVLAFQSVSAAAMRQLAWYDREGKRLSAAGKPGRFAQLSLAPDGKSVALLAGAAGRLDTWTMDLATGGLTRMTHESQETIAATPVWSPDSQRLAVSENGGGVREITVPSGMVAPLLPDAVAEAWTPDGRSLLCTDWVRGRVFLFTPGEKPRNILDTPYHKLFFSFSPDGQYVVYMSDEAGGNDVYVATFPSFAVKRKVSTGGGMYPIWSPGGNEVFYRSPDGSLMSVEIHTSPNLVVGAPKPLLKFGAGLRGNRFAVSPDGKRFLISEIEASEAGKKPEVMLVLNWTADIK